MIRAGFLGGFGYAFGHHYPNFRTITHDRGIISLPAGAREAYPGAPVVPVHAVVHDSR
jgi:hypothetical protein